MLKGERWPRNRERRGGQRSKTDRACHAQHTRQKAHDKNRMRQRVRRRAQGQGNRKEVRRERLHLDVRERGGLRLVADEEGIAHREISASLGTTLERHLSSIRIARVSSRDAFGEDFRLRFLAKVYHFRARVCLLEIVRQSHRIELADGTVAPQDARGVLPRHCRASLDLRPRDLRVVSMTETTLGHQIEDAASSILVTINKTATATHPVTCLHHRRSH